MRAGEGGVVQAAGDRANQRRNGKFRPDWVRNFPEAPQYRFHQVSGEWGFDIYTATAIDGSVIDELCVCACAVVSDPCDLMGCGRPVSSSFSDRW